MRRRGALGLTRYALSKLVSISYAGLRLIEVGERSTPRRSTVESIAGALECTPEWLLWGVGKDPS